MSSNYHHYFLCVSIFRYFVVTTDSLARMPLLALYPGLMLRIRNAESCGVPSNVKLTVCQFSKCQARTYLHLRRQAKRFSRNLFAARLITTSVISMLKLLL